MSTSDCPFMWFISKPALSSKYKAYELSSYIDKYNLIKETPKGWRVECRYNDQGRVTLSTRKRTHLISLQVKPIAWRRCWMNASYLIPACCVTAMMH